MDDARSLLHLSLRLHTDRQISGREKVHRRLHLLARVPTQTRTLFLPPLS